MDWLQQKKVMEGKRMDYGIQTSMKKRVYSICELGTTRDKLKNSQNGENGDKNERHIKFL